MDVTWMSHGCHMYVYHPLPSQAAVEGRSQQEQVLVVTELLRYKDIPAATRLARYCQIPRKFLPQEIRLRLEEEV